MVNATQMKEIMQTAADMAGVSFEERDLWDGARAVTLPRIVLSVNRLCPSLLADKFDREACAVELLQNVAG